LFTGVFGGCSLVVSCLYLADAEKEERRRMPLLGMRSSLCMRELFFEEADALSCLLENYLKIKMTSAGGC